MGFLRGRASAMAAALFLGAGLLGARPAAAAPTAQQVEAVFLFYFSQFVDWPQGAFADPHSPIVICVLGNDPFDGTLDQAVAGERVNGRPKAAASSASSSCASTCSSVSTRRRPGRPVSCSARS